MLNSILSKLDDAKSSASHSGAEIGPPVSKKARTSNLTPTLEIFPTLCQALHNIPPLAAQFHNEKASLEIEVRIGMLVEGNRRLHPQLHQTQSCLVYEQDAQRKGGYSFRSGIDEEILERLKRSFALENFKEIKQPVQVLHSDDRGNRWEVKDSGQAVLFPEKKDRFSRLDVALLAHGYDIRIDAAMETPVDTRLETVDTSRWTMKRIKKRSTFKIDPRAFWHIDVTIVESIPSESPSGGGEGLSSSGEKNIEIEFELEQEAGRTWIGLENRTLMTQAIATQLLRLIELCIPSNLNIPATAALSKVEGASLSSFLQQIHERTKLVTQHAGVFTRSAQEFMGAMPVNISRRNLQHIIKSNYYVTEKSDGARKLLFVVKDGKGGAGGDPIAILCDRAKGLERLDGASLLGAALPMNTILDGELVFNLSLKKFIYLVFDILSLGDEIVTHRSFGERLHLIQTLIIPKCQVGGASACTPIVCKSFHDKRKMGELMRKIKLSNGHRVFFDTESRGNRHHR